MVADRSNEPVHVADRIDDTRVAEHPGLVGRIDDDTVGQIKGDATLKMIPVVMLTSSRQEGDLVRSYQLGANAYIVKPVGFEEFNNAIRELGIFWAILNESPPDRSGA